MSMLKDTRTSLPGKDRPNAGERGHVKLTDVCATHPRNHHQKNASAHSCMEKSNCSKKKNMAPALNLNNFSSVWMKVDSIPMWMPVARKK